MAEEQIKELFQRFTGRDQRPDGSYSEHEPPALEPGLAVGTGESVAVELRRARQDLGRDVIRVAGDLKIRRVYLQAIEDGRFDDLPGATYAVGFIRAYADYLGLDSVEIVARFKQEVEGVNERMQLVFPTPAPESKIPSGAVLLISVLLIGLAYGGWYYLSSGEPDLGGQVLDLPATLEPLASKNEEAAPEETPEAAPEVTAAPVPAAPIPSAPEAAVVEAPEEAPAEALEEVAAEEPAEELIEEPAAPAEAVGNEDTATAPEPEPEPEIVPEPVTQATTGVTLVGVLNETSSGESGGSAAQIVPASAVAIPAAPAPNDLLPQDSGRQPQVYGAENEAARIILRARLDSWVQVYGADESLILTRVLQPGDSYRVPDLAGLTLVTGNAGGLEIEVDGTAVPPLGPVGAVRRGIALDAERLRSGTAIAQ